MLLFLRGEYMKKYKIVTMHKENKDITVETGNVFSFPRHTHSYYEMTLYQYIDGTIFVNDCVIKPQKYIIVLVVPTDFHNIDINEGCIAKYTKVSFTADCFEKNTLPETSMYLEFDEGDDFAFKVFDELCHNISNNDYKRALVNTAVCILKQRGRSIEDFLQNYNFGYGMEAVKIINENFNENLTLSSVAELLNITPQHLSNSFKTDIGMNFSEYLINFRLRHAEKLLLETDESVTKICDMCGYKNFSHFLRSFKKAYGKSPLNLRKNK